VYVTACLKRMQYYGTILRGLPVDKALLGWFVDKNLDPRSEKAAKDFYEQYKEAIEVDHIYPVGDISPFGTYDLFIHTDWGEDGLKGILPYEPFQTPKPFAAWISDTHIKTDTTDSYDYRLSVAKKADFVFVAQKDAVERMKKDGIANPIWLPHAVEPLAYPKFDLLDKKYDVCFVGHVNSQNRVDALDRLFAAFPNFYYGQQLFENAARKFAESKIVFNIAMTDDINMRNFEAMATGSFLLTNWIPTIEELFEDGKHLVLYRSLDEMVDKAKYYLAHDEERERIAQAGYEEVMKNHTIQNRVDRILKEYMTTRRTQYAGV
jgi:glycosyltransferase involved in cell wall biosynthesis